MKRVIIIHGWGGRPEDNWLPWLKAEIEKLGYQVSTPQMPNTDFPEIEKWVSHLAKVVGKPDTETYLIGHSIGCQTILRYLETINQPIGGALFVAGWFNLEGENEEEIARPWVHNPINLQKVKSVLPQSTLIISDNDPYGAFKENKKKFSEVVTKEVVLHAADHITDLKRQEILEEFKLLIQ